MKAKLLKRIRKEYNIYERNGRYYVKSEYSSWGPYTISGAKTRRREMILANAMFKYFPMKKKIT